MIKIFLARRMDGRPALVTREYVSGYFEWSSRLKQGM